MVELDNYLFVGGKHDGFVFGVDISECSIRIFNGHDSYEQYCRHDIISLDYLIPVFAYSQLTDDAICLLVKKAIQGGVSPASPNRAFRMFEHGEDLRWHRVNFDD